MQITSEKVIHFFESNTHLEPNKICEMMVDVFEHVMESLGKELKEDKTAEYMKIISKKLSNIETSTNKQNKAIDTLYTKLSEQVTSVLNTHRDYLLLNLRDTIKANQGDVKNALEQTIQQSQNTITDRLDVITKHDILGSLFRKELEIVHGQFKDYLKNKDNAEVTLEKMQNMISDKYDKLNDTFRTRMETFFASNQNTNGTMFSDILSRLDSSVKSVDNMNEYLSGQQNSSMKGKLGEKRMETILSDVFPTAEIQDTSGKTSCGDFIVSRRNRRNILIDTKDYKRVVPVEEIDKIIRDIEVNKCHGVLVSQNSGIANKQDMEIGVHNQYIIVYIHNAGYEPSKILMAANVIDYLDPILKNQLWNTEHTLSDDTLKLINEEYRNLARQKEFLIENVKKSQSSIIAEISKINLSSLAAYLDAKFQNTDTTEHMCCCGYRGKNKQALSAHRRYCKKKNDSEFVVE